MHLVGWPLQLDDFGIGRLHKVMGCIIKSMKKNKKSISGANSTWGHTVTWFLKAGYDIRQIASHYLNDL